MPPDSSSIFALRFSSSCIEAEQGVGPRTRDRAGDREVARVDEQVLLDREVGIEVVLLGTDPDPPPSPRAGCLETSRPRTVALPAVTGVKHETMRTVVVLPAPFGPRKPTHSPGPIAKSIASTAVRSP